MGYLDSINMNTVPFDPGFAPFTLVFSTTYDFLTAEIRKTNDMKKRKMKYKSYEMSILKLCDNLISFYFGGMLYGAYLANKYKNEPKFIEGNDFYGSDLQINKDSDVNIEVNSLEKFIKNNDKNPFATRKINPKYTFIIDNYIEFLEINNFFTTVRTTADLKIPQGLSYINDFSEEQLDKLYSTILDCFNHKKIERLLCSEYFVKINA